jgi:hypothetical protein
MTRVYKRFPRKLLLFAALLFVMSPGLSLTDVPGHG